jgi:hypothetical protein
MGLDRHRPPVDIEARLTGRHGRAVGGIPRRATWRASDNGRSSAQRVPVGSLDHVVPVTVSLPMTERPRLSVVTVVACWRWRAARCLATIAPAFAVDAAQPTLDAPQVLTPDRRCHRRPRPGAAPASIAIVVPLPRSSRSASVPMVPHSTPDERPFERATQRRVARASALPC